MKKLIIPAIALVALAFMVLYLLKQRESGNGSGQHLAHLCSQYKVASGEREIDLRGQIMEEANELNLETLDTDTQKCVVEAQWK